MAEQEGIKVPSLLLSMGESGLMKGIAMKTEPLIRATRKAYKASPRSDLDRLLAEKRKWSRRLTIAQNKLAEVQTDIEEMAREYTPLEGKTDEQSR